MNKAFSFLLILVFLFQACQKDELLTDGDYNIHFSSDTVQFDTVFSTIGSATKRIKIYNPNDKAIMISKAWLQGGAKSAFIINIDGCKGPSIENIRIEAHDSIFGLVQVFVNPTNQLSPLIIEDSIIFTLNNGVNRAIKLFALGQDVHLIKDSVLTTQTWYNDKPYLIYGAAIVDSSQTLTVESGCKIYFHYKGWMGVYGTLIVNGNLENPVIFRGDRLDKSNYSPPVSYDKIPGQWDGIRFSNSSKNNKINYALIRNATFGLVVGVYNLEGLPDLEISNSRVYNNYTAALFATQARIKAWNCVFANGEWSTLMVLKGGSYEFYHCTFANYPSFGVKSGLSVYLSNYAIIDTSWDGSNKKAVFYGDLDSCVFGNCILYGNNESTLNLAPTNDYAFEYTFDHCLIRGTNDLVNSSNQNRFIVTKISNKSGDAVFSKIDLTNYEYDFQLCKASLARESGNEKIGLLYPLDILGHNRTMDESPDIGAFEFFVEK
jgi:hypothetical protein